MRDVDLELLRVVRDLRMERGACTLREIGDALDLTIGGVQHRVDRALREGWLERSEVSGSLRIGPEVGTRYRTSIKAGPGILTRVEIRRIDREVLDVRMTRAV